MAVGFGPCDGVQDTIESTVNDAIDWARYEMRILKSRASKTHCDECGEEIPEQRRKMVQGAQKCVQCQSQYDIISASSYVNRRGSKDSQLR